jgi:hypothetical protein
LLKLESSNTRDWILLVHQLPARPTNLRVRIWRKLQKIGAVAIKNSVYVLPADEKTNEDFQWLKQEIESSGGEAAVFRAASLEGATDKEIIDAFLTVYSWCLTGKPRSKVESLRLPGENVPGKNDDCGTNP